MFAGIFPELPNTATPQALKYKTEIQKANRNGCVNVMRSLYMQNDSDCNAASCISVMMVVAEGMRVPVLTAPLFHVDQITASASSW